MSKYSLISFLPLLLIIPISGAFTAKHHPPPPPPSPLQQHQLDNIIDALIGAGDFNNWVNMLSASDLFLMLPLSATLFVPSDYALIFPFPDPLPTDPTSSTAAIDPLILPYHIVPQRLTFSQLTLFNPFSRLPTLLPSKSILITNTSLSNFTLDASHISYPDIYLTSSFAVHGISALLNYTVYGGGDGDGLTPPPPPPPPPSPVFDEPVWDVMGDKRRSDAAGCLYGEFAFVLLLVPWMVIWAIKIYGINPLAL
ncbi:hypothetical protein REPUB_Repub13aG0006400 [Reevesia pubescens]